MTNRPDFNHKIVLLGEPNVGKTTYLTSLFEVFSNDKNQQTLNKIKNPGYQKGPLVTEFYLLYLNIQRFWGITILFKDRFKRSLEQYHKTFFAGATGLIFICDLSRPSTYLGIVEWITKATSHITKKPSLIVIGNKLDLVTDDELETFNDHTKSLNLNGTYHIDSLVLTSTDLPSVKQSYLRLMEYLLFRDDI